MENPVNFTDEEYGNTNTYGEPTMNRDAVNTVVDETMPNLTYMGVSLANNAGKSPLRDPTDTSEVTHISDTSYKNNGSENESDSISQPAKIEGLDSDIPFWLEDPTILMDNEYISDLYPTVNMCYNEKLNALTRFIILVTVMGYVILNKYIVLLFGLVLIMTVVFVYLSGRWIKRKQHNENMTTLEEAYNGSLNRSGVYENANERRLNNPMDNVMLPEIGNDGIEPAQDYTKDYNTLIKDNIDSIKDSNKDNAGFIDNLNRNIDAIAEADNALHTFYTIPSLAKTENYEEFVDFLYGGMTSRKPLDVY